MHWKLAVKRAIPPSILNNTLLTFPFLYRTPLVNYETTLTEHNGVADLLDQLGKACGLPGDIIECGSSRCGASVLMADFLRARQIAKIVYAYDSFSGFDRDELEREQEADLTRVSDKAFTSTSYAYVKAKIKTLGFEGAIVPVQGYFETTLPAIQSTFCFALIDCDLKDSMVYCAETIWPHLASNGRIVFDDYTSDDFKGARLGVDLFVQKYRNEINEHGLLNRLYLVQKQ